jgi:hypothetical protein
MQTLTTTTFEAPCLTEIYALTQPIQKEISIPEERELSSRQINHYIDKPRFRETGYNTTTFGHIGFTRIEAEHVTDDILLQARLDILCDKLRAKY